MRVAAGWTAAAAAGLLLLPWYALDRFWGFGWVASPASAAHASGLLQALLHGKTWLLLLFMPLAGAGVAALWTRDRERAGLWLAIAGAAGLAILISQGFLFRHPNATPAGWPTQSGMGYGALFAGLSFLMLMCEGLALRGACRGDGFTVGAIGLIVTSIAVFVFFPIVVILKSAFEDNAGNFAPALFLAQLFDSSLWGLDCLHSSVRCGVAWNTLFLAVLVGAGTTLLGLAFALVATRTAFRYKALLRVLSVLPIITPPFVIGLAVILLFGRNGGITTLLYDWFDLPRTRWIYGLPGIFLAQLLAFTPIAFLVLIGVVQGISPSLEEASQTLRASR